MENKMTDDHLAMYNAYINDDSSYGINMIESIVTKYGGPNKGDCGCKQWQRQNYLNNVKQWFNDTYNSSNQ